MKLEIPALRELKCVPCRGGEPTVIDIKIKELHPHKEFEN